MKKALLFLFILVHLSFAAGAQRSLPPRTLPVRAIKRAHPALRLRIRMNRHPQRQKNLQQNGVKQEIFQTDSLPAKRGR
jgi:hypothetical protein